MTSLKELVDKEIKRILEDPNTTDKDKATAENIKQYLADNK